MADTATMETTAHTGVAEVNEAAHGADSGLIHNPLLWVALAFVTFLLLFGGKLKFAMSKAFDARATKIAAELEQAEKLRAEAEALKDSYQKKLRESAKEAEGLIMEARAQAARMVTNAEGDIKDMLERRLQQMMDRIDQQEQHAFDEVRDHVVDITIAAAKSLIIQHFEGISSEQMVRHVLTDLDRKVH